MASVREFLDSQGGKIFAGILLVIAVVAIFFAVRSAFGPPPEVAAANARIFVDAETNKPFNYELKIGDPMPVKAPSGKMSGYPAELCFWTQDGQIKEEPTAVLLNEMVGKSGPTFCWECGRLVVGHNPRPTPGAKPPPTKDEYRPGRSAQDEDR